MDTTLHLLTSSLHSFLSFIAIITVIVYVHEFGHYIVAKISGVHIEVFSIGFGPEIFGFNDKSGTRWKVCVVPLGGYVKMFGDAGAASTPDQALLKNISKTMQAKAFHLKPLPIKSAIVVAGPVANFLLSIAIFTFFFASYGKSTLVSEVGSVVEGSAAEEAGLKPGDIIETINDQSIEHFMDIQRIVSINPGVTLPLEYTRSGKLQRTEVTPKLSETKDAFGNIVSLGVLGVTSSGSMVPGEPMSLPSALIEGAVETYQMAILNLRVLGKVITGTLSLNTLGGPVKIAKYSSQSVDQGVLSVLMLMATLSVGLGLINLLPIPMLDGGHLMFYIIEAVYGKPVTEKFQEYCFRTGLVFLVGLMLFITFNDVRQLLTH